MMNQTILKKSNILFTLLITINFIFFFLSGDFKISVSSILQGRALYQVYIIIWLGLLGYYFYTNLQQREKPIIKFYLIPISILIFLFFVFVASPFGSNSNSQESIWFAVFFYFLAFPAQVFNHFNHSKPNQLSAFKKMILLSIILASLYILVFYGKFYFSYYSITYGILSFLFATLIFAVLTMNAIVLLYLIYKLIRSSKENTIEKMD
jgi:hypothetical protein